MSDENVAVVRGVCAAWQRGDWAASVGRYDSDLKVVYSTSAFPDAGTYRGGRVALDAWNRWLDAWEKFGIESVDLIDAGEQVIALIRLQGRGKESGATVVADQGVIFECDHGTIKRIVFCDRGEALEAAGLSE
jgi:ketosteroid isomerase-like protein